MPARLKTLIHVLLFRDNLEMKGDVDYHKSDYQHLAQTQRPASQRPRHGYNTSFWLTQDG